MGRSTWRYEIARQDLVRVEKYLLQEKMIIIKRKGK